MATVEVWKDIVGYEGLYMISNHGRVKSLPRLVNSRLRNNKQVLRREVILNTNETKWYKQVALFRGDGSRATFSIHRLVAKAFIPNPNDHKIINHIDSDPSNNHYSNLEWCTQSHNIKHAYNTGRKTKSPGFGDAKYGLDNPASRQVAQYLLDGTFVKQWDCVTYIQKELGFNRPNICKCCRGKINTAYGYKWEYA